MAPYSPGHDAPAQTPPNFLGYLNPEAVLREHVYSEKGKSTQSPVIPSIGQWIEGENPALGRPSTSQPGAAPPRFDDSTPTANHDVKVQRALHQYLDAVGVTILPPRQCQDGLLDLYLNYVHPLLPLVDQNVFAERYAQGHESRLLMQAICIVASKHADAGPFLCLGNDPRKMGPREFSHRLYNAVIAGIEAKLEKNRVVLIQVLALISLHCEGPDGAEQASMHLAQAIHHAHTFGLQFGHQWKNQKSDDEEDLEDLFWCLWSLDKINACMNGRPLLMHERDNSLTKLPTDPEKRQSPFGVWLQISEMLDKVIDYYRPGSKAEETGWEGDDFLGFEEMVGDGEDKLDGPIMSKSYLDYADAVMILIDCRSTIALPPHHVHGIAQVTIYKRPCQINAILRPTKSIGNPSDPSAQRGKSRASAASPAGPLCTICCFERGLSAFPL